jgi:hypothetical protein
MFSYFTDFILLNGGGFENLAKSNETQLIALNSAAQSSNCKPPGTMTQGRKAHAFFSIGSGNFLACGGLVIGCSQFNIVTKVWLEDIISLPAKRAWFPSGQINETAFWIGRKRCYFFTWGWSATGCILG